MTDMSPDRDLEPGVEQEAELPLGQPRGGSADKAAAHNPKLDTAAGSNTQKDPDDWVTGDEPMTGAQASYLKTLSEEAHSPQATAEGLTKAEASKKIDALKRAMGR